MASPRIIERSAILSADGRHRHVLNRKWGDKGHALIIGLNPSTADHNIDDATVRKLYGFGERIGFRSYELQNLWSFRATKPKDLRAAGYPVHERDLEFFANALASKPDFVICAWGANARGHAGARRASEYIESIRLAGLVPKAFMLMSDGTPWHPLMLPYSDTLVNMP